jgi:alkylation response protein AidB-like acyl-CoA dehydrogenase
VSIARAILAVIAREAGHRGIDEIADLARQATLFERPAGRQPRVGRTLSMKKHRLQRSVLEHGTYQAYKRKKPI